MKKLARFIAIYLISFQLLNCERGSDEDKIEYTILSGACGTISLDSKIGNDFFSALDSLITLRESSLTGGCPGAPCYNYYIDTDTLGIDYDSDNREFIGIIFKDISSDLPIFAMSDVIDTYGNYYTINWCDD
jgi:hypothetical protein